MLHAYRTERFTREAKGALSAEEYRDLDARIGAVVAGTSRGRCLRIPWLWELKCASKRLYYVLQEQVVLFVAEKFSRLVRTKSKALVD